MSPGPVLIGIEGLELTPESREQLRHPMVGGVVLFARNFESRDQLIGLVRAIRDLREPRLLLAADQEGGRVQRFRDGFTQLPALACIGDLCSGPPGQAAEYAYWHARTMAGEMLEVGIDLSFAPVLDLDRGSEVIGDRAFSGEPDTVIGLGRAYLAGMHDAGMKTTGKHFPGHGSVKLDSHVADVCDDRGLDEIEASDLMPFKALVSELDAMMIAHVVYPCVDDKPAGYSRAWLAEQLRRRTGFRGVIFSDDLGMHAAQSVGGLAERTHVALASGCDAVLVCRPEDVASLLAEPGVDDGMHAPSRLQALYGSAGVATSVEPGKLAQWRDRLERLC